MKLKLKISFVDSCLVDLRNGGPINESVQLRQHKDKTRKCFVTLRSFNKAMILNVCQIVSSWKRLELELKLFEKVLKSFLNPITYQLS